MNPPFTFAAFVGAVHGVQPFPWQQRLADRAVANDWPSQVDVFTGLGKTMAIDAAVYALAASADVPPGERRTPTRIAFIVDRRVVVQAAYEHALEINAALDGTRDVPVLRWAREQLLSIVGETGEPLVVTQMRGGVTWESRWVRSPQQPAVVVGTVDQLGSRLLFRGYGTSDRMKPIDAALIGTDALIVLDEAHMSSALVETVTTVRTLGSRAVVPPLPARPVRVLELTATPRNVSDDHLIGEDDLADPVAGPRLRAVKRAHLVDVVEGPGGRGARSLGAAMAAIVRDAIERRSDAPVVLVVANTISLARDIYDELARRGRRCELVVGRCRSFERETNRRRWWADAAAGRVRESEGEPLVVVATQTVEVGADLDVDVLVTEAAPIEALVQRFGRVDRLGIVGATDSFVVHAAARSTEESMPYGAATARTWTWLAEQAGGAAAVTGDEGSLDDAPWVDFGPIELRRRLDEVGDRTVLMSSVSPAPVVVQGCIEVWRRTSPVPDPDESIIGYLHGFDRGDPSVAVAWRAGRTPDALLASLTTQPLRPAELVEVSIASFARFWRGAPPHSDASDLEWAGTPPDETRASALSGAEGAAVVLRGQEWVELAHDQRARPGDVIVLDVSLGGHDQSGWTGTRDRPVVDIADLLAVAEPNTRARPTLRLDPGSIAPVVGVSEEALERQLNDLGLGIAAVDEDTPLVSAAVETFLSGLAELTESAEQNDAPWPYRRVFSELLSRLRNETRWSLEATSPGGHVEVIYEREESPRPVRLVARSTTPIEVVVDADDGRDLDTSRSTHEVTLRSHLDSVGDRASDFGRRLGLRSELVEAVGLAGRFHDLGKADARFQALLRGGPRWIAEVTGPDSKDLLAKSSQASPRRRRARPDEWPIGYRHEAISLTLLATAPADVFDGVDRALVAHLVASHHGFARPLFPAIEDRAGPATAVDYGGVRFAATSSGSHPGWSHPATFTSLCERYGSWGLALLESIVRLADISISEEGR